MLAFCTGYANYIAQLVEETVARSTSFFNSLNLMTKYDMKSWCDMITIVSQSKTTCFSFANDDNVDDKCVCC